MPDDQSDAIGIIGALSDAGLLRTAASGTRGSPASGAVGIIGALSDVGLLAAPASATAGPPPEPGWGPEGGGAVTPCVNGGTFRRTRGPEGSGPLACR
jgi:hypothetical protein